MLIFRVFLISSRSFLAMTSIVVYGKPTNLVRYLYVSSSSSFIKIWYRQFFTLLMFKMHGLHTKCIIKSHLSDVLRSDFS